MLGFAARRVPLMDLSLYLRRHVFRRRQLEATETVGFGSVLWALVLGPLYYWKKGARFEALLLSLAGIPLFMFGDDDATLAYAILSDISTLVWIASIVCAPLLLAASLRRHGWVEISETADAAIESARPRSASFPFT